VKRPPRTQQVSPGGQSAPAPVFHTLFAPIDGVSSPDYMPEPIAKIFVTRFESRGQVQALRPFRPEELQDNSSVHARFGGGTYELVARREDGTIYAKRLITLEGEPKSMNGEPMPAPNAAQPNVGGVPLPSPPPQTGGENTMMSFMMQTNITMMTMLGNVMVAMVSGAKNDAAAQAAAMGESMKATIEVMKSAMPVAPPPPPQASPVAMLKEVLEVQKLIQPQAPPPPKPKEETTSDIIAALGGALGPFMQLAAGAAQAAPGVQQAAQAASSIMQG